MEYELYHHGVLGMKWGVRHYRTSNDAVARRVRAARYALVTENMPKSKHIEPKRIAIGELANARRASNIQKSELIDRGKAFVKQTNLSDLKMDSVELRVLMARHALRR